MGRYIYRKPYESETNRRGPGKQVDLYESRVLDITGRRGDPDAAFQFYASRKETS